jgi:pyruvate dehydrogenase E1 component alpha subunit
MRSVNYGSIPNLISSYDHKELLTIFRKMCMTRYFELELIKAVKDERVTYQVYLSLGQESISAAMSSAIRNYQVFAQHRCHAIYLALGGSPEKLRDELLGLPSGTSRGRSGSNCIQCHENGITMYGHHGLIGENVPLAVGAALGNNRPTVCFFGDGAAEEDYVFASIGYAITHKLPVLFVCEDNNLSILTPIKDRRSWSLTSVANAIGMLAIDITDDPWSILYNTRNLITQLPAFMNIYTCRSNWHSGVGVDGPLEWDRWSIVKEQLNMLGLQKEIQTIENDIHMEMEKLWVE